MKTNLLSDYKFKENQILKEVILTKMAQLIDDGDFILGSSVLEFEKNFSQFCNSKYCIGTSSGTSALSLAIRSLELQPDEEVIVPALTFISTALAIQSNGAKVVYCDIDKKTFNIDPVDLERKITPKTKAIIPVHLYGQMAQMEEILEISNANEISIIEDASQAHGATSLVQSEVKNAGVVGKLGCFSFYPTKNLGAMGDAGCIVTDSEILNDKIKALRNYGQFNKNDHAILGDNARLDSMQAVILNEKLKILSDLNRKRQEVATWYFERLSSIGSISLPFIQKGNSHTFHQFVIRSNIREKIISDFKHHQIDVGIHYPVPMHLHSCFKFMGHKKGDFKEAESACREILSLPMSPFMTKNDVDIIGNILEKSIGEK